jgi:hypothetical protein
VNESENCRMNRQIVEQDEQRESAGTSQNEDRLDTHIGSPCARSTVQ